MALAQTETIENRPASDRPSVEFALEELEHVYGFIFARVGNRLDAEDLTQQVAMKALHKLREGAEEAEIRAYLFATARTVMATFWHDRSRIPELELLDNLAAPSRSDDVAPSPYATESVAAILGRLKPSYRLLLELRFLRGYSLREVAFEMGKTVGAVKVMQLRALREAATVLDVGDLRRRHAEQRSMAPRAHAFMYAYGQSTVAGEV